MYPLAGAECNQWCVTLSSLRLLSTDMTLLLLTASLLSRPSPLLSSQSFSAQPSDLTVNLGSSLSLPCQVVGRRGEVQWTRDNFGLGVDRELRGFRRYTMVGAGDPGDYTLHIDRITLQDDAT